MGMAAVHYLGLLFRFPEPSYVLGWAGPRRIPSKDLPVSVAVTDPKASEHRQIVRNRANQLAVPAQPTKAGRA
jgi:hypothetical protein